MNEETKLTHTTSQPQSLAASDLFGALEQGFCLSRISCKETGRRMTVWMEAVPYGRIIERDGFGSRMPTDAEICEAIFKHPSEWKIEPNVPDQEREHKAL